MRINLNEVLDCEIPRPPNEETEEEKISKAMTILKETNQSGFSNIRKSLIDNHGKRIPSAHDLSNINLKINECNRT